jgi:hypothetical protein
MYWAAAVKTGVAAVAALGVIVYGSFAIYEGSWSLAQHNIVHQQGLNNAQYNANKDTQQYQDTYKQETDKTYQQITADKYDIATAKSSGDTTAEQDAYATANSDIHAFCTYAQELTPDTRALLGPNELGFYQTNC